MSAWSPPWRARVLPSRWKRSAWWKPSRWPAPISVADIFVKAADVDLIEVRLGRGMGGKSYVIITGEVAAVEASVRAAEAGEGAEGLIASSVVIPSPHMDMIRALM